MTVVVVSNRVAHTKPDEPMAGGLAAALLPAVKDYGAIWVGSSGRLRDVSQRDAFAEIEAFGKGATATIDLPQDRYCGYYNGFANSALWPALHSRADLIRAMPDDYASYREVNAYMARALIRFCAPDALFWIHDYHLLTLGLELRRLGVEQPIGFFLHTPWPERTTISAIPHHRELVQAMLACSLVGFQTDEDRRNFIAYVRGDHSRAVVHDQVISEYGACRLAVFPVGIDVEEFVRRAAVSAERPEVARLRSSLQVRSLSSESIASTIRRACRTAFALSITC